MIQTVRHIGETVPLWPYLRNLRMMARQTPFPKTRLFWRAMLKRVIADYREQQAEMAIQRKAA